MEEYKVLTNLPEEDHFGEWEKADVKAFGKWFMEEKGNRIRLLTDEIHRDPEFVDWQPDFTPDSLKVLNRWFERHIEWEPMPEDEFRKFVERYKGMANCKNKWITKKSESLVFDVSIYFGEVLLHELGDREWEQITKGSTRNYDYGCMTIPVIPKPKPNWAVTPWRRIETLAARVIYNSVKEVDIYKAYLIALESLKTELLKLSSNKETPNN